MRTASSTSSAAQASASRVTPRFAPISFRSSLPRQGVFCSAAKAPDAQETSSSPLGLLSTTSLALMPLALDVHAALAKDGELGLLEGRSAALVHPAFMFAMLAATGYAGFLGWQWRRTREIGEEIRELRKLQPAPAADGTAVPDTGISAQLQAKEQERKELLAGNFKDKHFWWGSLILATGTGIAIEGAANTFIRTGKLFPGPHLYAGALMVSIWALAAAMVPEMSKGNNTARTAHIGLNVVNFLLFLSQVPTGLEIVGKVFQFTSWP